MQESEAFDDIAEDAATGAGQRAVSGWWILPVLALSLLAWAFLLRLIW